MSDLPPYHQATWAPSGEFDEITPNDATDFEATRGLIIGTAGDLHCIRAYDLAEVTVPVPAGQLALRVTRIYSAGTTAADIVGLW